MKYKGIEIKEFESEKPVLFDPPKRMLVWNDGNSEPSKDKVFAFFPNRCYPVIGTNDNLDHCAEIPEQKEVTNRELACWLAKGHGEARISCYANTYWGYSVNADNDDIPKGVVVRQWDDTEWHKPTREYLGLEGK